jgi:hypothetical protein
MNAEVQSGNVYNSSYVWIGAADTDGGYYYQGFQDEVIYYSRAISGAEVTSLFNNGNGLSLVANFSGGGGSPPTVANISFSAVAENGSALSSLNLVLNGVSYNTTTGNISTNLRTNTSGLINYSIWSTQAPGYYVAWKDGYNASTAPHTTATLYRYNFLNDNATYGGYISNST